MRSLITAILTVNFAATLVSAADSARYRVDFDATWSRETHPTDFPARPHFSGLIGGTHDSDVTFWEVGGLASDGIESMAETGSQRGVWDEVLVAIDEGTAKSVLRGQAIGNSPDMRSITFDVSESHSLVSLVSMIAPSPDWFVGVSGFDLRPSGEWLAKSVTDLFVYDSGTDSGPRFISRDEDTQPPEPIRRLDEFPFENAPPVGTFTFTRLIAGDFDESGNLNAGDLDLLASAVNAQTHDASFDLNGDESVDRQDRVFWIDNLANSYFGDSNLDGEFNASDLTLVFQAGEYEDAIEENSTWATGDWNGDNEFSSDDLVTAFADGGFEIGPRLTVQSVPEPAGSPIFLTLAIFLSLRKLTQQSKARRDI